MEDPLSVMHISSMYVLNQLEGPKVTCVTVSQLLSGCFGEGKTTPPFPYKAAGAYSWFNLRKARSPLILNGECAFLRVNRL